MVESIHNGEIEATGVSKGSLDEKGVSIEAIKQSEDGEGVIIRLIENYGKNHNFAFDFMGRTINVKLEPYKIKTIKVTSDGISDVNLIER